MRTKRALSALTVLTVGGLATVLPAPAQADVSVGFSSTATATPVRIEIYSPTIPIPASPQAELNLDYTTVESASGPTAHGRSSWLWPGDPVGEGLKTFAEALGLPSQLAPLYDSYAIQSNSYYPGDSSSQSQSDTRVPGAVESTSADDTQVVAKAGYSPDGDIQDGGTPSQSPSASPSASSSPSATSTPLPLLGTVTSALPLSQPTQSGQKSAGTGGPVPPGVSAIVDFGAGSSVSHATYDGGTVTSYASSRMHDISLLGGLITMDGLNVTTKVTTTLEGAKTTVDAHFVGLRVNGNQFKVTKDGIEAVGQTTPGYSSLPTDPGQALKMLGVTFALPKAQKSVDGASGSMAVQGLQVIIDTPVLHKYLDSLPLNELANMVPDIPGWPTDQGAPTPRSLAQTLVNFQPKIVLYLGNASSAATAVAPIDPCLLFPGACGGTTQSYNNNSALGNIGSSVPMSGSQIPTSTDAIPTTTPTQLGGVQNVSAGLPPLKSIPTMLVLLGLVAASALGWWLQRMGSMMLGTAGACAHGAESGIPDLRKV